MQIEVLKCSGSVAMSPRQLANGTHDGAASKRPSVGPPGAFSLTRDACAAGMGAQTDFSPEFFNSAGFGLSKTKLLMMDCLFVLIDVIWKDPMKS